METQNKLDTPAPAKRHLVTVRQFCEQFPAFTEGSLRWLLFHRESNGIGMAVYRVGKRKLVIDVDAFFRWLDEHHEALN